MVLVVFLLSLAANTLGGECGIGGGVIVKPLLDAMNIMPVNAVSFLSGLTVLSMAAVSVAKSSRQKELAPDSVPLGLGAAAGGVLGKQIFEEMMRSVTDTVLVGKTQSLVLGLMMIGTLLYVHNRGRIRDRQVKSPVAGALIGLALGIVSSFLGIGSGPMNMAVLYYFFSMDTKRAAVNSILVIFLSQVASLAATLITGRVPPFEPAMLAAMLLSGVLGGYLATRLYRRMSEKQTGALFTALLCFILALCVYNIAGK